MAQGGVSQGGRNLMTVVALLLVSFCLYYKSGDFDFIYYDDVRILAEHPELYNGPSFADS
jgi:hypothetical protein